MSKSILRSIAVLATVCAFISCKNDLYEGDDPKSSLSKNEVITKSGGSGGVRYSLKNVSLNPDILLLNHKDIELINSVEDLGFAKVQFKLNNESISDKLTVGRIIIINNNGNTYLRKINSIELDGNKIYRLNTTVAHLGEIFEGGDIDFSVDLYKIAESKQADALKMGSSNIDRNYFYEILNLNTKYNQWGFDYNPATNVSMALSVNMNFDKKQLLPSKISTIFELNMGINPYLAFNGSINKKVNEDLVQFVPQSIIDKIKSQEFEIDIPINALGIENLPAKISIKDIYLPTLIEANLSKQSNLTYGINGKIKIGNISNITGLKAVNTPVYENSLTFTSPSTSSFNGDLITSTAVVIKPNISILNSTYKVAGDLSLTFETETNGHFSLIPEVNSSFGSKGVFIASSVLELDLFITKLPIEVLNYKKELWNVGVLDKTIEFANLRYTPTSTNTTNILNGTKSYKTNFTLDYKYRILGKMIPEQLFISYDVFQKNGTSKMISVSDAIISLQNISSTSFSFLLDIPFKKTGGIFSTSYETESYIKNIVIKDNKGYVYEGVLDPVKKVVEDSFLIKR